MTIQPTTIAVHCPKCDWRILDKISPTSGEIQVKCPRCHKEVQLNLSLRRANIYRRRVGTRQYVRV
jgi:DNA-directed RNA polymerase subunit RPC12/RpoP